MKKNGMLIALMNEYRKSAIEYKQILTNIPQDLFEKITDDKTKNIDCKSIQSITFHIIQSGYTYSNYINSVNEREWFEYTENVETPKKGIEEIDKMLDFTENSFNGFWNKTNKEIGEWKFDTRWNVTYDFEQLMEHAIVHVLRHRRQIENVINNNG